MSIEFNLERLQAWQAKLQPLVQQIGEVLIGEIQGNWSGATPSEAGKPSAIVSGELAGSVILQIDGDEGASRHKFGLRCYVAGDIVAK